jgi:pyridoxal phosphate enzyme (YggS family)
MVQTQTWRDLHDELAPAGVTLVAVSKTKPVEDIRSLYELGQRDFGENYVQELVEKVPLLPDDVRWHFIGHLQTNKVKAIAKFVHLIHAVDSFKLLAEISKQASKHGRVIDVLLQLHVAEEDTKHGLDETRLLELLDYWKTQQDDLMNVRIRGLMAMASFTENDAQVGKEFQRVKAAFDNLRQTYFFRKDYFDTLSTGMSGDYRIAVKEGSTMVRIGSALFGIRG